MTFELTILGTSSATPTPDRHPSAQYLAFGDHHILVDCGEGAQIQMMKFNVKSYRIDQIYISHLHPDHYLGLPGYLSSLSLKGRTEPLDIFAPKGMKEIIEVQFLYGGMHLTFEINYHILDSAGEKVIFEDNHLKVISIPVVHRISCWGFVFTEKKMPRKINKDHPDAQRLPIDSYSLFRSAKDYISSDGTIWKYEDYTIPNEPPYTYAYITDSLYLPTLSISMAQFNIDLLYHEATFLHELSAKAIETCHTTAKEAAEFARNSGSAKLIIGHFSSRYKDPGVLLDEALAVFPNTVLALEGEKFCN